MKVEFEFSVRLVTMLGVGGSLALFALHAAFPGLYKWWPQGSQDLAAWVQAVGSVAAIIGAVWATKYQIRRAKEAAYLTERQKALHLGLSALHVATRGHRLVKNAAAAFKDFGRYGSFLVGTDTKFQNAIASAEIVLAKDLDAEVLKHLLDVRSCMSIAGGAIVLMREKAPAASVVAPIDMVKAKVGIGYARWQIRRYVRSVANEVQVLRGS